MTPPTNSSSSGAMTADTPFTYERLLQLPADTLLTYRRLLQENTRLLREQLLRRQQLPARQIAANENARQQPPEHTQGEQHSAPSTNGGSIAPDAGPPMDAFKKEKQRERQQTPGNKQERKQHPAQPASSGSIKVDEEFLKLIELRDARLAKNARVEYIDGKRYEWAPGNVAGQRNSSLSATFAPTPNFYDVLDDAVCTPSVPPSAGPNVNREQQKVWR